MLNLRRRRPFQARGACGVMQAASAAAATAAFFTSSALFLQSRGCARDILGESCPFPRRHAARRRQPRSSVPLALLELRNLPVRGSCNNSVVGEALQRRRMRASRQRVNLHAGTCGTCSAPSAQVPDRCMQALFCCRWLLHSPQLRC